MTGTIMVDRGVGEERLRERRRRFWRLVAQGVAVGGVAGLVVGFVGGFSKGWQDAGGATIGWVLWPVLAIVLAVFSRYCVKYFRRVDELDVQDNLWASLIGLYGFLVGLPSWHALHLVGQLPPPDLYVLYALTIAVACVAYGWRKIRHRF